MSTSILDYLDVLWIRRDVKPDFEAMRKMAKQVEAEHSDEFDEDDLTYAIEKIEKVCQHNYDNYTTWIHVGPYVVYLGYDSGWFTWALDEHGIAVAGGFWQE